MTTPQNVLICDEVFVSVNVNVIEGEARIGVVRNVIKGKSYLPNQFRHTYFLKLPHVQLV